MANPGGCGGSGAGRRAFARCGATGSAGRSGSASGPGRPEGCRCRSRAGLPFRSVLDRGRSGHCERGGRFVLRAIGPGSDRRGRGDGGAGGRSGWVDSETQRNVDLGRAHRRPASLDGPRRSDRGHRCPRDRRCRCSSRAMGSDSGGLAAGSAARGAGSHPHRASSQGRGQLSGSGGRRDHRSQGRYPRLAVGFRQRHLVCRDRAPPGARAQ